MPQVRIPAVFAGGCLGGLARYLLLRSWTTEAHAFPWATLLVNCSGAFVLGLLLTRSRSPQVRALLGTGFCGAWTTFSAITVSVDQLVSSGHVLLGLAYLVASAGGGLAAAWLGLEAGRRC